LSLRENKLLEEWVKLHNEDTHNVFSSQNIIRVKKSRRIRWLRHVASIGKKVKQSHNTPMEAQGERGDIAPTHSRPLH
jgi:hypothetical protein